MAVKSNCVKNGKDYYRITRVIGHKADGTAIRKEFYGKGVKEANEKAEEYMRDLKNGMIDSKYTIATLLPTWLFEIKKNEIKKTSFESYYSAYTKHIKNDTISYIPIKDLKSIRLQKYYNELSPTVAKKVYKLLNQFFKYAEHENYILKNPNITITLQKTQKDIDDIINDKICKFQYFNEAEIPELLKIFENTRYYDVTRFALGTGMRRGEIYGLQWNDIDFNARTIYVRHNLSYVADIDKDEKIYHHMILQTPKSQNSVRIIPISDTILEILNNLPHYSNYVFSSKDGKPYDLKWSQKFFAQKLKATKFEGKRFHDLRHTFATLLLSKGADLITVKELMGHSSVKITEMYLDALPSTKSNIVNKLIF